MNVETKHSPRMGDKLSLRALQERKVHGKENDTDADNGKIMIVNVIVDPCNVGTANGAFIPLERSPTIAV